MSQTVEQKVPFSITPKDSAGVAVDFVAFPTALTDIQWSVNDPAQASVNVVDNFHAELVPNVPGNVTITVVATNIRGDVITENATVLFDALTPLVMSLGLAQGDAVPK